MEGPPNRYEKEPTQNIEKPLIDCTECGGSGKVMKNGQRVDCTLCHGKGKIRRSW